MTQRGQITTTFLIGTGLTILLAAFGSIATSARITDTKIEKVRDENVSVQVEISALKTSIQNIEKKQDEQTADIKAILRELK